MANKEKKEKIFMKKVFVILFILLLICGCATKGGQESQKEGELGLETKTEDNSNVSIDINDNNGSNKENESLFNYENTRELEAMNGVSLIDSSYVRCRIPVTGLRLINRSSDGAIKETDNGEYFVALTAGSIEANKDNMFDTFVEHAVRDVDGECEIDGITIVKSSTVRIGDVDALYFEGFVKETREHFSTYGVEMYATGYVFLDGNYVNGIWGAVIEKDQTQDSIDWVNKAVDYMVSTVSFEQGWRTSN